MMKSEFEALAGYEVSEKVYNTIIEPMYMATSLNKVEFVNTLNPKAFALPSRRQMVNQMRKIAKHLYEICGHYTDFESERELERLAHEYAERFHHLNWSNDLDAYILIKQEYEVPGSHRGCSFPVSVKIGHCKHGEYETIRLIKEETL